MASEFPVLVDNFVGFDSNEIQKKFTPGEFHELSKSGLCIVF